MNRSEFENWMKGKMDDQPFSPGEDMWQKLQSDLQKPAGGYKKAFLFLQLGITLLWVIENLVFLRITEFPPYYRLVYSFIIVLLSVNQINYLIIHDSRNLLKNAQFLICIAFIIFFMYQILYEIAYQYRDASSDSLAFSRKVSRLFVDMNIFINLLFGVAAYFIPKKEKFSFTFKQD
jgi:hypothetical protein